MVKLDQNFAQNKLLNFAKIYLSVWLLLRSHTYTHSKTNLFSLSPSKRKSLASFAHPVSGGLIPEFQYALSLFHLSQESRFYSLQIPIVFNVLQINRKNILTIITFCKMIIQSLISSLFILKDMGKKECLTFKQIINKVFEKQLNHCCTSSL